MKKSISPAVRAERRRCLRLVEAWETAFIAVRDAAEPGAARDAARSRVNMLNTIASEIRRGVQS